VSENGIAEAGARGIASALRTNAVLVSLGVASNDILDEGACAIAAALQGNSALTSLNLRV
jgi:hypothetical protein